MLLNISVSEYFMWSNEYTDELEFKKGLYSNGRLIIPLPGQLIKYVLWDISQWSVSIINIWYVFIA